MALLDQEGIDLKPTSSPPSTPPGSGATPGGPMVCDLELLTSSFFLFSVQKLLSSSINMHFAHSLVLAVAILALSASSAVHAGDDGYPVGGSNDDAYEPLANNPQSDTGAVNQGYDQGANQSYDQGADQGYDQGADQGYQTSSPSYGEDANLDDTTESDVAGISDASASPCEDDVPSSSDTGVKGTSDTEPESYIPTPPIGDQSYGAGSSSSPVEDCEEGAGSTSPTPSWVDESSGYPDSESAPSWSDESLTNTQDVYPSNPNQDYSVPPSAHSPSDYPSYQDTPPQDTVGGESDGYDSCSGPDSDYDSDGQSGCGQCSPAPTVTVTVTATTTVYPSSTSSGELGTSDVVPNPTGDYGSPGEGSNPGGISGGEDNGEELSYGAPPASPGSGSPDQNYGSPVDNSNQNYGSPSNSPNPSGDQEPGYGASPLDSGY
ncbi:hypothetical protein BJ684DRAFT_19506 [Piptocephalis cylindrospora]|uniref:Uncharacterized protein n=1 Tax=Piptocephalis cylindrospora TaxID=1907219 RepID=A0A4P9Y555_9FUNG|nr:hypothetical protein BJ684DRAFT_19506 [Piptocephalis cylindrospora]|eukprot:RKP14053.1 hypothetical protein BJ684DRAFT_19506 [Piptocephalis cylindrospora]